MATITDLAAELLRSTATFLRAMSQAHPDHATHLEGGAQAMDMGAEQASAAPGEAAALLRNAANFMRTMGEANPPYQEQMETNAQTCEQVAGMMEEDPNAELPVASAEADKTPPTGDA